MNFRSAYFLGVLGAASAALCFAVSLALPAVLVMPKSGSSIEPGISDTIVNRSSKGDRMRIIVRPPDATPFEVQGPAAPAPKSLDGCESAFGWQAHNSSAASLAQSCVT